MIIKREIYYPPSEVNRTLHIHLPDNYDQTDEQYPVMYFFDGHNLFRNEDATYGTCWGLEDYLNRWRKPMIVVGLECSHEGNQRLEEYSPYDMNTWFAGWVHGIGQQTLEWLVTDVKSEIDRSFRTCWYREATGIAGSSMGGLMALYAAIRFNRWFSKAACLSSSVALCGKELRRDIRDSEIDPDTRVYLSWGAAEQYRSLTGRQTRSIESALKKRSARTLLYCQPEGRHCEADWGKQVPDFMEYLWFS